MESLSLVDKSPSPPPSDCPTSSMADPARKPFPSRSPTLKPSTLNPRSPAFVPSSFSLHRSPALQGQPMPSGSPLWHSAVPNAPLGLGFMHTQEDDDKRKADRARRQRERRRRQRENKADRNGVQAGDDDGYEEEGVMPELELGRAAAVESMYSEGGPIVDSMPKTEEARREREVKVLEHLEHLFSERNLASDKHLSNVMHIHGGWVPLTVLIGYKIKKGGGVRAGAGEMAMAVERQLAIHKERGTVCSTPLELSPDHQSVHAAGVPDYLNADRRTIVIERLAKDASPEAVLQMVAPFGKVESVDLLRKPLEHWRGSSAKSSIAPPAQPQPSPQASPHSRSPAARVGVGLAAYSPRAAAGAGAMTDGAFELVAHVRFEDQASAVLAVSELNKLSRNGQNWRDSIRCSLKQPPEGNKQQSSRQTKSAASSPSYHSSLVPLSIGSGVSDLRLSSPVLSPEEPSPRSKRKRKGKGKQRDISPADAEDEKDPSPSSHRPTLGRWGRGQGLPKASPVSAVSARDRPEGAPTPRTPHTPRNMGVRQAKGPDAGCGFAAGRGKRLQ